MGLRVLRVENLLTATEATLVLPDKDPLFFPGDGGVDDDGTYLLLRAWA